MKSRDDLKKHVRAAKEWLGEAEESLDRAQDIRGDLNVMLAKAELQRASEQEVDSHFVRAVKLVGPLLVAVFLVGCLFFLQKQEPVVEVVKPKVVESAKKKEEQLFLKGFDGEKKEITKEKETLVEKEDIAPNDGGLLKTIPSEEMQRLMCTAGQSLRAH